MPPVDMLHGASDADVALLISGRVLTRESRVSSSVWEVFMRVVLVSSKARVVVSRVVHGSAGVLPFAWRTL